MKAGQRADSNFHNFNDIDTACYGTVAVKKRTGQHPTILTSRLVSVKVICSMMAEMPSNTVGFGSIKYISAEDRLKKRSPFPIPRPIIKMSAQLHLLEADITKENNAK